MSLRLSRGKTRKIVAAKLVATIGVLILVVGLGVAGYEYMTNRANAAHIATEIDKANRGLPSSMPATTKPDDSAFRNYQVAPDAPRYIYIDKISVKAMVKQMGLTKEGAIESPANVHDAGWFTNSAKPGQPGAMVVDGHVANWATKSVFHDLKKLHAADIITIERGDGTTLKYEVVKTESYAADKVDMTAALAPIDPDVPGLNLITCDGRVVKGNTFDRRLIVFTRQL